MLRSTAGSLRLFRVFGVNIHVHWLWFPIAVLQVTAYPERYTWRGWAALEYVSLFGLVLLHELGHALACRSVGGKADDVVLWPLGGVTLAQPPARPAAVLWTVLAGPLVNLVLVAPFLLLSLLVTEDANKDLHVFFKVMAALNVGLFVLNMVPVYPLDGGQALHALLWPSVGRWRSLEIVSVIGVAFGAAVFVLLLLLAAARAVPADGAVMGAAVCLFIMLQAVTSLRVARHVQHMENLPRHADCACPTCHVAPPLGAFWRCDECEARFDLFETRGKCPSCGAWYLRPACPHCRETHHVDRWFEYRPGVGLVPRPPEPEESRP